MNIQSLHFNMAEYLIPYFLTIFKEKIFKNGNIYLHLKGLLMINSLTRETNPNQLQFVISFIFPETRIMV